MNAQACALDCSIRIKGHLTVQWSEWFGGLAVENQPGGECLLSGRLPDQSALYGVLECMRNLGISLLALECQEIDGSQPHSNERMEPTWQA